MSQQQQPTTEELARELQAKADELQTMGWAQAKVAREMKRLSAALEARTKPRAT